MKANTKLLFLILFSFINSYQAQTNSYYNYKTLDTNNIQVYFNNIGNLELGYTGNGAFWKILNLSEKQIVFNQGPWIIGKINGELKLALAQWKSEYSPGPIIDGKAAMIVKPEDSLKYRIYKINKDGNENNPDYVEWPADFGAPVDNYEKPKIYRDQTLWCVYNAADSTIQENIYYWGVENLDPIPIELHQLAFSRGGNSTDEINIFSNTIFIEYCIINKGSFAIDSAFFGFWTDIDFNYLKYNYPAIDTSLQTSYCWSGIEGDTTLGEVPPSVGYTLLYGPVVESTNDEAVFKGNIISGYRNLGISSFHPVIESGLVAIDHPFTTPITLAETWNIARGFDRKGNLWIDPTTNEVTKFPVSGDPITNSGWLYDLETTGGEAGFYMFSGPFTLAPNDTQWVMLALVPGLGRDRFESIKVMREKAALLRTLTYDSLAFGSTKYFITDVNIKNISSHIDKFELSQNYPNPFNPKTTISYQLPEDGLVTLEIFDVLGMEVSTLVNGHKTSGKYQVKFDGSNLSSGIYFYTMKVNDFVVSKKMLLTK